MTTPSSSGSSPGKRPRPQRGRRGRGGKGAAAGKPDKNDKASKAAPRDQAAAPGPREVFHGLTLNDFQMEALGPLREGRPVLLAAPTGSGKTLVAEIAIEASLAAGKRAIYTAPVKALSNQKYRDFKAQGIDVGVMTGDVTIDADARVLIMTTEILRNSIFEDPERLADVDTVVFDEVHYMDDPDRGTVWEESIVFAPPHIRFVCLSATISNLDQLGEWISSTRGQDVAIIRHRERPVPLDHYLWFPKVGLKRIKGAVRFPRIERDRDRGRGRGRGRGQGRRPDETLSLVKTLQRGDDLPALFFCFSRKECERRGRLVVQELNLLPKDQADAIEKLFDEICDAFELEADAALEELRGLMRHGVAYHHAGMLPLHKEVVERLFTSGMLRLLFATETFSIGINMPARAVVFAGLRKFDGVGFSTLKVREYQQMAGRAGRQGMDERGMVISIIDDDRVQPHDVERLIGNDVEPVQSRFNLSYNTLINLHRTLGDQIYEAWERSFNNFQWARMSGKKREKNEQRQRQAIAQRLELLTEIGCITPEGVTEKGRMAAAISGYELQIVQLYDSGLLTWLNEIQLAVVFAAVVFEERKNDLFRRLPTKVLGAHRKDVELVIDRLVQLEKHLGIPPSVRPPNFKIGVVVQGWCMGETFDDMGSDTTAPAGDLVRSMRLTIQLLRQLQHALPREEAKGPLGLLLGRTRELLNRDAVDAARQLSLG